MTLLTAAGPAYAGLQRSTVGGSLADHSQRRPVKAKTYSPQRLAAAITNAKSKSARMIALRDAFAAIGLGVRTSSLRIVVPGGGSAASGFYLYDAELSAINDQLARKTRTSFDDLSQELYADGLSAVGSNVASPVIPASELQHWVMVAEQKSLRGTTPADRVGQLIRDVGLLRHSDLSHRVAVTGEVLDPLQHMLIILAVAAVAGRLPPAAQDRSRLSSRILHRNSAAAAGLCDDAPSNTGQSVFQAAKTWLGRSPAGPVVDAAFAVPDIVHAAILGYSVAVSNHSGVASGDFGMGGPGSASPMKFQALVEMLDNVPDSVINCGTLAGYTIPKKGPIPNIKVDWDLRGAPGGWGIATFTKDDAGCGLGFFTQCPTTTDGNGIATLEQTPDDEWLPGVGPRLCAQGGIVASALTLSSTGNASGSSSEATGATKFAAFGWDICWHQAKGYAIQVPHIDFSTTNDDGSDAVSMQWLGEEHCLSSGTDNTLSLPPDQWLDEQLPQFGDAADPADPAFGYYQGSEVYTPSDSEPPTTTYTTKSDFDQSVPLPASAGQTGYWPYGYITGLLAWNGGGYHETLNFDLNPDGDWTPSSFNFDIPLTEATDCPTPVLPPPPGS
jgi:hypothetical protein